ncbi:DUF1997 domain-containing protein [Romeria aff. gracilis LEGE 07310]|uniref:DUF1997 domain-containing protein n=1 Tax=Vasconcelosia minhoensis LEGE 07310 TaxID=915328 RepID=A0A8J7AWT6_9CYAN|nr:DUF1997 domain-containing protein [Romeria gracilis]MBE9078753.1 DUF1997 domain-containing protein [Romeria aff. gracilis LEGE 07310]
MQVPSSHPSKSAPGLFNQGAGLLQAQEMTQLDTDSSPLETVQFQGNYIGQMEMYADAATVAEYLDAHQGWFGRCARPMSVEPIGENGYALTVGRFGSLNLEIEPRIGLHLLPQDQGIYRIETIPVPGFEPKGYEVDFQASMTLCENGPENAPQDAQVERATHVEWDLTLCTLVQMPRFIQALPHSLVKASGDKLLNQIVRQVSRRLTKKVQEDFHNRLNLPVPSSAKKGFWQR